MRSERFPATGPATGAPIPPPWPLAFNVYQFSECGRRYVYCGGSMYLFRVDDLTAQVIEAAAGATRADLIDRLGLDHGREAVAQVVAEIDSLYSAGVLTAQGDPLPVSAGDRSLGPAWPDLKDLWLILTHDCNLRCAYCFSRVEYMSGKQQMDEQVALKGIDFLFAHSRADRDLSIVFFGGEPLLCFHLMKAVVAYTDARAAQSGRRVRYCITTNGVNLTDSISRFLVDHAFHVMVSLDGDRAGHDAVRVFPDGRGSYDVILPKVRALNAMMSAGHGSSVGRCTLNRGHQGRLASIYAAMADELGFTAFSTPLIHAPAPSGLSFSADDLPVLEAELAAMGDWFVERAKATGRLPGLGLVTAFLTTLHQRNRPQRGCAAGRLALCLDVDGSLYPCERFVGLTQYRLGSVLSDEPLARERIEALSQLDRIGPYPKCRDCYAAFYCKGTCAAERVRYQGTEGPPASECSLYRLLLRRILSIYVRLDQQLLNRRPAGQDAEAVSRGTSDDSRIG